MARHRLGLRNIYIWPSREGVVFLIGWAAIFLCAVNFNNALIYALAFLLAGIFMVSLLHTYTNLYGIELHITSARPVYCNEAASFPVYIHSPTGSRGLVLSTRAGEEHAAAESKINLRSGAGTTLHLIVPMHRRGLITLHQTCLESRYPNGLFRVWTLTHTDAHCLVYPRPAPDSRRHPPTLCAPDEHSAQPHPAALPGAGDFQGFRAYQPGDPPRSIFWKSLRSDTLLIQRFGEHEHNRLVLDWDRLMDLSTTEARLSQLCSWVLTAYQARTEYELRLPGKRIPAAVGIAHKLDCLEALARYEHSD